MLLSPPVSPKGRNPKSATQNINESNLPPETSNTLRDPTWLVEWNQIMKDSSANALADSGSSTPEQPRGQPVYGTGRNFQPALTQRQIRHQLIYGSYADTSTSNSQTSSQSASLELEPRKSKTNQSSSRTAPSMYPQYSLDASHGIEWKASEKGTD